MPEEPIRIPIEADDSALVNAMNNFLNSLETVEEKVDVLNQVSTNAFSDIGKAIASQDEELRKLTVNAVDYNIQAQKQSSLLEQVKKGISETAKEYSVFGVNIGNVIEKLGQKRAALKAAQTGLSATAKGFKLLRAAIISTGIGALVVALGSLIAFLGRTEKGLDLVNKVLAGVGATINVVVKRLATFGEGLGELIKGDFAGFMEKSALAVSGLGKELRTAAREGYNLAAATRALRDQQRAYIVDSALLTREIQEQQDIANDTNKTYKERTEAQQKAIQFQDALNKKTRKNLEDELSILEERKRQQGIIFSQEEELAQARAELIKFDNEANSIRRADEMQLNEIYKEQRERIKELRGEYISFINEISNDARRAELEALEDPIERLAAQRDLATQQLQERIGEARQKALLAGLSLPPDFDEKVRALFTQIDQTFAAEVQKIESDQLATDIITKPFEEVSSSQTFKDRLAEASGEAVEEYAKGMEAALQDNRSLFEKIEDFFTDLFGVDEDELRQIADLTAQTIGDLSATFDNFYEAQIINQERIVQALDNQISQTQELLNEELERRKRGFANDAELLEENLEKQIAAREEAERKRLELEKKAANQRLLINSLEQGSNYVLAATKLVAAEAGKGIIGIFTALTGLGLILKIISQAKRDSAQFQEVPQFRTGTEFVEGPGTGTSDSIHAKLSRGERVLPARDNSLIGGAALSNQELVENNLFAMEVRKLLRMTGQDDKQKMLRFLSTGGVGQLTKEIVRQEKQIRKVETENNYRLLAKSYEKASDKAADRIVNELRSKPKEYTMSDGTTVREWEQNGILKRQVIERGENSLSEPSDHPDNEKTD